MPHKEIRGMIPWKEAWARAFVFGAAPWVVLLLGLLALSSLSRNGDEVALARGFAVFFALCSLAGGILAIYYARQAKREVKVKVHRVLAQAGWILGILDVTLLLFCSLKLPGDAQASRRAKEEKVKVVAYKVEMTLREYQRAHAGLKPNALGVLELMLPDSVKITPNPFVPRQTYNLYTGGLVDRMPHGPGQIGYLFQGQDRPYKVIANGWRGPALVLEELPLKP